ncbi:helix-turn-helix domain-containing protein [Actinoplanes utahensis]|uniref:helix-turn-helix domain-containing protein n=1 Tax=Actinoplanes utahensis TaxID=1869 RepID=UPI000691364C|nr:helix-turn-helix transcriptional regulator [Actinoplanes utahensis]GIF30295.1 transcriptional regulator [Actinoplanes utahensis]
MSDSPEPADQPVETIGQILARCRRRQGLSGQALGDRVGMSQAKISRLETGVVAAEPGDVRMIAGELGLPPAEVERLVELAEHADNRVTDWIWAQPGLATIQSEINRIEAAARELRIFQPAVVPGLLQTSGYAWAVMTGLTEGLEDARLSASAVTVSEAVTARIKRSELLMEPGREFRFLISEQVLRNRVCGPADMIAQIQRLRDLNALDNVHILIVPDDATLPMAPLHGFYVADNRLVSADLLNTTVMSKGRETVRTYRRAFDTLERVAVSDIEEILSRHLADYVQMMLPAR